MAMAMAARSLCLSNSSHHRHRHRQHLLLLSPSSSRPLCSLPFPHDRLRSPQVIWAQHGKNERSQYVRPDPVFKITSTDPTAESKPSSFDRLPVRTIAMVLVMLLITPMLFCGCAHAVDAIKASKLGLSVAANLRGTGWPDEAIVFVMAMLPVLELRGAIPVGYWMRLDPIKLSLLAILGNMVPVPLILLYMEKLSNYMSNRSPSARKFFDRLLESVRRKAGPVQEFEWLGLMLFVAVPFPGTGAWTGAMVASVLGMPFWDAMSANFLGVVMAGLLVNLVVNVGLKTAALVGIVLFLVSTFMWSFLRVMVKSKE